MDDGVRFGVWMMTVLNHADVSASWYMPIGRSLHFIIDFIFIFVRFFMCKFHLLLIFISNTHAARVSVAAATAASTSNKKKNLPVMFIMEQQKCFTGAHENRRQGGRERDRPGRKPRQKPCFLFCSNVTDTRQTTSISVTFIKINVRVCRL